MRLEDPLAPLRSLFGLSNGHLEALRLAKGAHYSVHLCRDSSIYLLPIHHVDSSFVLHREKRSV